MAKAKKPLRLVWDPLEGVAFPEGRVVEEAARFLDEWREGKRTELVFGQDQVLNEFRIRVSKKMLEPSDLEIVVNGEVIEINDKGRLNHWPQGFCDLIERQLSRLI